MLLEVITARWIVERLILSILQENVIRLGQVSMFRTPLVGEELYAQLVFFMFSQF